MATNAPKSRKTHVIRIFGTNKKKEILHEIWADVERIDRSQSIDVLMGIRQRLIRKFRWRDDPADAEEYLDPDLEDRLPQDGPGAPKRKTVLVKVCDPDSEDLNDPEEWIPIRALKKIKSNTNSQKNNAVQLQYEKLINDDLSHSRVVEPRRIVHYDTNIDDAVQKAIDEDPSLKAYVVKGENYTKDMETKDKDQWVEHEIVTKVIHKGNSVHYGDGSAPDSFTSGNQVRKTRFLNQYLIDDSEPATLEITGSNGFNPPYRLDPFQNIVNIQLSSPQVAVLGITSFPAQTDNTTQTSKDGTAWAAGFDGASSNAATGLGHTVVCTDRKFVAFGKPRDGNACFITATEKTIERGILDARGDLTWTVVSTLPIDASNFNGIKSCCFAGDAFFVSYINRDDSDAATYLAASFNGETFSVGVQPFKGVVAASIGSSATGIRGTADPSGSAFPLGGNVAYDKKNEVYVTTGTYQRNYVGLQSIGASEFLTVQFFENNFMSSTSRDGVNWSPKFDISECSGFGAAADGTAQMAGVSDNGASNVTFGNELFVATTGYKVTYDLFSAPTFAPYKLANTACSVATSRDGKNWTNQRLPGSISTPYVYATFANSGGLGASVKFFKTPVNKSGVNGFFVATGVEFPPSLAPLQSKLWSSEDGIVWKLIRTDIAKSDWILSTINKSRGKIVFR